MAHVAGMVYITLLNNIVVTETALLLPLLSAQNATSEAYYGSITQGDLPTTKI